MTLQKRSPAPLAGGKSRADRSIKPEKNSTAAAEIEASRLEAYARIDVGIYPAVDSLTIDGGRA